MRSTLPTFLFGNLTIATAGSGQGKFEHSFGGPHDRKGASREDCSGILIHLLHRLDLNDPAIPISIPGIRWLPLYYCFDFRANVLGYQLISDDSLVTFFPDDDPNVTDHESWPDEDYPLEFPKSSMKIAPFSYDPTNMEDAYAWAGIFGVGKLTQSDLLAVKKRVEEESEGLGFHAPETDAEYDDALSLPFMQGKPTGTCMNPRCVNHETKGQLSTIALMPAEPVKGVHTFGEYGSGVQLIFQLCSNCNTIRVSNQCD
jgi:hypothetical protein